MVRRGDLYILKYLCCTTFINKRERERERERCFVLAKPLIYVLI